MNKVVILVATHKKYTFPASEIYVPIHVGRAGKPDLGYLGDNTKDNISLKNASFCELTAMYFAWKNIDATYIGLNHYRRYFTTANCIKRKLTKDKFQLLLTKEQIETILKTHDIIVTKEKNLFFYTIKSKYKQQHHLKDLMACRSIIASKYPMYIESFDKVMKKHKMSICNMYIMNKKLYHEYCTWLFEILFTLEKDLDISTYTKTQQRVFGFLSERLFNVWLDYNNLTIKHLPILALEHDSLKTILQKISKRLRGVKS